jgi:hypothetical protein
MKIELSKTGLPVTSVGGGAYSNTFSVRFVLNRNKELKNAIYVRTGGQLSGSLDQALVVINEGNYIVEATGNRRGISKEAWALGELTITAHRIVSIDKEAQEAKTEIVEIAFPEVPKRVWEGAGIYHNRDALYFCNPPQERIGNDIRNTRRKFNNAHS